ncbi:small subunit ribosomal protein S15 [Marchantia polymorpha subsp. ruderalis]
MRRVSLDVLRSALWGRSVDPWVSLMKPFSAEPGQQLLSSRSFAADAEGGEKGGKDDEKQTEKTELGRWWQAFSEQSRSQQGAGSFQKTAKEDKGSQWFIPKNNGLGEGQEQGESTNKEASTRWFLPAKEGSPAEQDRQEITSKQVGARWLASTREKSSTDTELSDLSSIPWFGSNGESPASERERLEVSLQRLALMSKLGDNSQAPSFMFLPPKDNLLRKYFHWDNLSSPEKHKIELEKVRRSFRIHPTDCGSSQVQIALLTNKIKYMTQHMGTHRKDYHSRKGLEAMVSQRRRLLKYLRRKDWNSYCDVISKLGLRDNVMDAPSKR